MIDKLPDRAGYKAPCPHEGCVEVLLSATEQEAANALAEHLKAHR